ncbi:hypothetical protein BDQ17DRAFT_1325657 [Cyathus striatus]|nr:hypothetical protein BDQ17DRAFT_1325657 [Cyathus striatus]
MSRHRFYAHLNVYTTSLSAQGAHCHQISMSLIKTYSWPQLPPHCLQSPPAALSNTSASTPMDTTTSTTPMQDISSTAPSTSTTSINTSTNTNTNMNSNTNMITNTNTDTSTALPGGAPSGTSAVLQVRAQVTSRVQLKVQRVYGVQPASLPTPSNPPFLPLPLPLRFIPTHTSPASLAAHLVSSFNLCTPYASDFQFKLRPGKDSDKARPKVG